MSLPNLQVRRRALPSLLLPLIIACVLPNPAFQDDTGATSGPTAAASETTATTATTAMTETTTETVTVTMGDETGETTGSTSTGDTGDTESTGEPLPSDCWGLDLDDWEITQVLDMDLGIDPDSPRISPDGLTLYYIAGPPQDRTFYRALRPSVAENFVTGDLLAEWPARSNTYGYPNVLLGARELIVSGEETPTSANIYVSVREQEGQAWSVPEKFGIPVNTEQFKETIASVSEDGRRMIIQRQDGPPNDLVTETWSFYEFSRPMDPQPGLPFIGGTKVEIPAITEIDGFVTLCPTLSPDGLHLFFGSTHPKVLEPVEDAEILKIFATSRATRDDPWEPATELPSLSDDDPDHVFQTCPSAVTRDGCQLFFHRFQLANADPKAIDAYRIFIADRTPEA